MLESILDEIRLFGVRIQQREEDIARTVKQSRASWQVLEAASVGGSVPRVARTLGKSRQAVQRVADGLAECGLVTYQTNPDHRRSPLVTLTERGLETLQALRRAAAARHPEIEQDIEPEDLETTLYVLRALREAL